MTAITADSAVAPRRSFQEVWVISFGHALTHWYPATFYLLLPLIGKELGLDYSQIGSILACQYAAGAIANIPGGIFVDTVGRKGLLMAIALCWIGFPYLIMGFSHTYSMMLFCATLVGIGNNLWHPTAIPWLANRFPERKGLVMSIHGMGGNVGDAVAPLVMGALLGLFNWRDVVFMNVVPGIVLAVIMLVYIGRKQTADLVAGIDTAKPAAVGARTRLRMFGTLLQNRALITLAAGSAFRSMTQGALLTFLPLYLARVMGYPTFWIGACLFALQAAGFIAAPIAGHMSDRVRAAANHPVQHVDERRRHRVHDFCRWHALVRASRRRARLLPVRGARGAAGVAPRRNAARHGRQRHRPPLRFAGARRGHRSDQRRHRRRSLRHHGRVLFSRRHDPGGESAGFRNAGGVDQEALTIRRRGRADASSLPRRCGRWR